MLLLLEDDTERLERFAAVLRTLDPMCPLQVWRDAHAMIREAGPLLPAAALISLDHDLEPGPGAADPGDGYLVARWLVSQPTVRPVIVHSSNGERSSWMAGEFDLAGWRHWRVPPLGDDWIESDWCRVVRRLLHKGRRRGRGGRSSGRGGRSMDESPFWGSLEFRLCREFAGVPEGRLRYLRKRWGPG
jgi:hypothetical protein